MTRNRLPSRSICLIVVLPLLPSLLGSSCGTTNPGPTCSQIAVPSLTLNIRDTTGAAFPAATVQFRVNNETIQTGTCSGNCGGVVIVYNRIGTIQYAVSFGGYVTVSGSVNVVVDSTGCFPVSQAKDIILRKDDTAGTLAGAWSTSNFAGQSTIIRFDAAGAPVGAILTNRSNTGDGNLYFAFNGRTIAGAAGQTTQSATAPNATRAGNSLTWSTTAGGFPIGFENAALSSDLNSLTGTLIGSAITYTRLSDIPAALRDPS